MTGRLDRLLRPRSLAFVGGAAAELAIDACRSFGFTGQMWAVNPHRQLRDVRTVGSVSELPDGVDAAFVGVGRHAAAEVVRDLAAAGAGAVVCYASGFAETGEAGAALQRELVDAAAAMPLVGPNCYGTLSAVTGAALWPDVHGLARCPRGVALVSQSGNVAVNLTMQRRGLDISHLMALGNQADVGLAEALEALVADEAVTGVGLYLEAVDDIDRFAAAADLARRRGLPVVALKLGASEASGTISVTHTASLVGSDAAYDALFRRLGVRRVHTVPELLDTLAVLAVIGPLEGNRIVSLSCSGGEAALVADRSQSRDLAFPAFSPEHGGRVAAALGGRLAVTNPLDYHTFIWGDEARLTECFDAVLGASRAEGELHGGSARLSGGELGDAPFDAAVLVLDLPAAGLDRSRWWPTLDAFGAACAASGTPGVLAASMAENLPEEARVRAAELGLAACGDIDNALRALEAAAAFGRSHAGPPTCPVALLSPSSTSSWSRDPNTGADVMARHEPERPYGAGATPKPAPGQRVLSEYEAKQRLAAGGITVPLGRVVVADEAADAAAHIGFPVVVKTTGEAHKSDVGGVAVGLVDSEAVAAAAERLRAGGDGTVLVEACIDDAVAELLVSVRSAPPVGMLVTLGAGGTLVELFDDTAGLLLPIDAEDIRKALRSLRIWPLLAGHRGRPSAAVDAVAEVVVALGSLVRDDRAITEVEINPLLVTPRSAIAADALMAVVANAADAADTADASVVADADADADAADADADAADAADARVVPDADAADASVVPDGAPADRRLK